MSTELQRWEDSAERQRLKAKIERLAQLRKWGPQKHSLSIWLTILAEEVGELAQEVLNHELHDKGFGVPESLSKEAIQVAAVALAIAQYAETGEA